MNSYDFFGASCRISTRISRRLFACVHLNTLRILCVNDCDHAPACARDKHAIISREWMI